MYSSRPPKGPQQQQQQYNNSNNNSTNNNNNNKMGSGSGGGGNNNNSGSGGGGGGVGNPVGANNIINTIEACERIKEEYTFIQSQNQSLKLELEKLSLEKTEMQRHYVMYYEMSYGLNVEMHKQTEIAKRLSAICAQLVPYLSQEHQQQVSAAIERAKQVTMSDLNSIIGQQIHAQQFPHIGHGGGGQGGQGGGGGLPAHLAWPEVVYRAVLVLVSVEPVVCRWVLADPVVVVHRYLLRLVPLVRVYWRLDLWRVRLFKVKVHIINIKVNININNNNNNITSRIHMPIV
jgi:hypothetical protein